MFCDDPDSFKMSENDSQNEYDESNNKETSTQIHTAEEMRMKRLAFFDKGQSQTKEWKIERPSGHTQQDVVNVNEENYLRNDRIISGERLNYQPQLSTSQGGIHNSSSSSKANPQVERNIPVTPTHSSEILNHSQMQRRNSDLTENGPVPLRSKRGPTGISRSSALSSSMDQLSLEDSGRFSVFKSQPDLDDLGLSTHRPDSETSARSIPGEIYIPSIQGSGKTPKQIFSHKTREELHSALGDKKMEELMNKVTHDIGELKGRNQSQNLSEHQGYQNIQNVAHAEEGQRRDYANSKLEHVSPRRHSLSQDASNTKDYRSLLVQNHDQVMLPKSARNSFSSEEIYRQAYGDGMMYERQYNRGLSNSSTASNYSYKPPEQQSQNDGQYALNSSRSSLMEHPGQMPIRHPLQQQQGYPNPYSYPPPSIPPSPFDNQNHHPRHPFQHNQSPHSTTVPMSPQSSYSGSSFPYFMHQPPPPYSSHNQNNPHLPQSYHPNQPHPYFHDPNMPSQYGHMYGMAQNQGRAAPTSQAQSVVNSSLSAYSPPFSSAHYGPSRISAHPGINAATSLEHQAAKNNAYQYSQPSHGVNQSFDSSLSHSGHGLKMPHPPANPPALQGKEDLQSSKTKSLEHRRVTVPPSSTQQTVTSSTGEEFNSFNLQRYFSSMELHTSDYDKISATPIPQSSRSVEGDYYKQNADNEDNVTSFTNMTGVTSASKAVGLTSRLQELGVDLDHLKHLKLIDGQGGNIKNDGNQEISFDAYAKSIRRCPECKTANKAYMDWCVECGEVLIGVDLSLPRGKKNQTGNNSASITSYDYSNRINGKNRSRSRSGTREKRRDVVGGNQSNIDVLRFTADDRLIRRESPESGKGLSLHSSPARNRIEQDEVLEPKDSGRASNNGEGRDQYLDVGLKNSGGVDIIEEQGDEEDVNDIEEEEEEEFFGEEEGVEYVYEDVESNIFEQISDPILRDFIISYRNKQINNQGSGIFNTSVGDSHDQGGEMEGNEGMMHSESQEHESSASNVYDIDGGETGLYSHKEKSLSSINEDGVGSSNRNTDGTKSQNKKGLEYRNKPTHASKSNDSSLKPTPSNQDTPTRSVKKKSSKSKKKKKPGHEAIDIEIFGYEESRLSRSYSKGCNIVPALNLRTSSDEEEDDEESEESSEENDEEEESKVEFEEEEVIVQKEPSTKSSAPERKTNPIVSHQNTFKKTKEMLASRSAQGHPQPLPSKSQSVATISQSKSRSKLKEDGSVRTSSSSPVTTSASSYQRHWARSSTAWSSYNPRELNTRSSLNNFSQNQNRNGDRPSSARANATRGTSVPNYQGGSNTNNNNNNNNNGYNGNNAAARQRPSSADYERRKPVYSNTRNMTRPSSAKVRTEMNANNNNNNNNNMSSSPVPPPKRNNYLSPSPAQAKRESSPVIKQRIGNRNLSSPNLNANNNSSDDNSTVSASSCPPGQGDDSLHILCPEFHRLPPDQEEQTETADKMHAIAKSGYVRFHELTPRIQDGDMSLWQCLPDEVWLYVLTFLSQNDLGHLMSVSKGFYRLANDQSLWRYITVRPHFNLTDATMNSIMTHHPISLAMVKCQGHELSTNALEDFFRETQGRLKELNICGCSHGALVGSVVLETASKFCQSLTHLDASFSNINDDSFTAIVSSCDRLESVCINGFQSMTDSTLLTLVKKHGTSLRTLELYACFSLSATVLRNLGEYCHDLRRLCLGGCNKLTASTMITLSTNLARVEELDLRGCRNLKNECIRKIVRNCPRIQTLVLANCQQISNPALVEMGTYLKNTLRIVDVCGCDQVGDEGVVSLVKNCDRLTSLDISSTGCMHSSLSAIATSGCGRWIETLKLSFLSGISEANLSNLLRHCPRLKLIHTFGCSSLRNLTRLRDMKPGVTIEGDVEVPRLSIL